MGGPAGTPAPHTPVRTCVGCRGRDPQAELVRLVAVPAPSEPTGVAAGHDGGPDGPRTSGRSGTRVVPDPMRRLPGRGAHLHPDPACVERAVQRRAIPRALRLPGDVDLGEVISWAEGLTTSGEQTRGTGHGSGTHAMSTR
ncbi:MULTISPECIES: YlxR family protein [Kytococcus]|uniref:DUF448 domain-containing protein n=1 Tax=Kytococcus schroeteri TaxID=138300 RepID=A0A2I1PBC6_9MICO|nr:MULTISPECIES: YlxR family protein [Kytococcus]PKZ41939.1 DUF448 domain-containing protein [Kytococcus schroeteri]